MKVQVRASLLLAALALVVAVSGVGGAIAAKQFVITSSSQIKNGAVKSPDLRNSTVRSADVLNGTVAAADIGTGQVQAAEIGDNQVTPAEVELPAPAVSTPNGINGAVTTGGFTALGVVGNYTKVQPESSLEVGLAGAVASGPNTNCVFQLRVNGAAGAAGGGEVFAGSQPVNVSTAGVFAGAAAGPVTIEVWARASEFVPSPGVTEPTCIVGPAAPGIETTVVVAEAVV